MDVVSRGIGGAGFCLDVIIGFLFSKKHPEIFKSSTTAYPFVVLIHLIFDLG
jgi:hypothetical protein